MQFLWMHGCTSCHASSPIMEAINGKMIPGGWPGTHHLPLEIFPGCCFISRNQDCRGWRRDPAGNTWSGTSGRGQTAMSSTEERVRGGGRVFQIGWSSLLSLGLASLQNRQQTPEKDGLLKPAGFPAILAKGQPLPNVGRAKPVGGWSLLLFPLAETRRISEQEMRSTPVFRFSSGFPSSGLRRFRDTPKSADELGFGSLPGRDAVYRVREGGMVSVLWPDPR